MSGNRESPSLHRAPATADTSHRKSAVDAWRISSRAALGSLVIGFAAFLAVLPTGRDAEAAGQELFLVCFNLLPLAAIGLVVSLVGLWLGRLAGLHIGMGLLSVLFILGLLGLFAQIADMQSKTDRIYGWVILVSGGVQIATHWAIAFFMARTNWSISE